MRTQLHAAALCLLLVGSIPGFSQPDGPGDYSRSITWEIQALRDSIKEYDAELGFLQHFLEVSTVDPKRLQHTNLKCWVLGNPELRDSLFYALMASDSSLESEAGAEAELLATASNDLIEVRFGNAVFKGMTLRKALEKSGDKNLYRKIVDSYSYSKDIELRDPAFRLQTEFDPQLLNYDQLLQDFSPVTLASNPHPVNARVDLSMYGAIFKIGPSWGGEIKIGNDEIGLPFWSSGKTAFMATYNNIKLGFELPLQAGRHSSELFPPFILRGRKLNGTRGVVGAFDFGPVGGTFSFTRLTSGDTDALTNPDGFLYITGIAQSYFSFGIALDPTNLVRVKAGAGIHRVNEARISRVPLDTLGTLSEEQIIVGPFMDVVSPYLKFEYLNKDVTDRFGVSVQFYDFTLVTAGTLEIVQNVLSLELKYVWPMHSQHREWQNPELLIVSPHIRFSF